MNRTRIIALLMAFAMLFSLAACSSEGKAPEKTTEKENPLSTEPTAEVGESGELIYEGANGKCLFENESCSFTLMKAEIDSLSDYCWDVTLVNSTTSAQIFTVDQVYVNDYAFDPVWAVRVEAGQTLNESIIWSSPEMEARGIMQITRVDLNLRVYAQEDHSREYANVALTSYPSGKSAYIPQARNPKTTDVVLMDTADFSVIITGFDPDDRWGAALKMYLLNKTQQAAVFTIENVIVGGYDLDPQFRRTVPAGKQALADVVWFERDIEEIGDINGITFDLVIRDTEGNGLVQSSHVYVP